MTPARSKALTAVLRAGNPWLIGHNYGRIAPIFFINSLLRDCSVPGATERVQRVLDLLLERPPGEIQHLPVVIEQPNGLSVAIRGALAADRRAFKTARGSALFPVDRRLIVRTGSDDGLGRRALNLIRQSPYNEEFRNHLEQIYSDATHPMSVVEDPVTRFGRLLSGPMPEDITEFPDDPDPRNQQSDYDNRLASFIVNACQVGPHTQRLSAIRALAYAGFMASILRMLQGPIVDRSGSPGMVVVYAGLPPGNAREPTNVAAIASLRSVARRSWDSAIDLAERQINVDRADNENSRRRILRQSLKATIGKQVSDELGLDGLFNSRSQDRGAPNSLREFVVEGLGGGSEVLIQRVRGLATKIGFASPDRGTGGVRLALDTPLLGVLVDGIVRNGAMKFETFISRLRTELGLVVGVGEDDSFVPALEAETFGTQGRSLYDLLMENEQELRRRLIRTGLARTYSDAHTEVIASDA